MILIKEVYKNCGIFIGCLLKCIFDLCLYLIMWEKCGEFVRFEFLVDLN